MDWGEQFESSIGGSRRNVRIATVRIADHTRFIPALTEIRLKVFSLSPISSYFTQCEHRIYLRRSACWEIASQRGHCK